MSLDHALQRLRRAVDDPDADRRRELAAAVRAIEAALEEHDVVELDRGGVICRGCENWPDHCTIRRRIDEALAVLDDP